ncbi:MAG: CPBP family intramembrane metalloprotease [Oscillospiraceae bacterium]|nr:CPBP family intramembrane metalloprotease [Oscillospiraceae bacterium]
MRRSHGLGAAMNIPEQVLGWIYFPFYIVLLQLVLPLLLNLLAVSLTAAQLTLTCAICNFVITIVIFHRFLFRSLGNIAGNFWAFVQAAILGFVFYFAANWALNFVLSYLAPTLENPANAAVQSLSQIHYGASVVFAVLLAPLTEELLVRGLLFGTIARRYRYLAYVLSILVYGAIALWSYAGMVSVQTLLFCAIGYIPAGIALGWTYEKAGNIWAPFLVHAAINAVSLGLHLF